MGFVGRKEEQQIEKSIEMEAEGGEVRFVCLVFISEGVYFPTFLHLPSFPDSLSF